MDNLRSAVAKQALLALADLFRGLRTAMDAEVMLVLPVLLKRCTDTNDFLIETAEQALATMTEFTSTSRALGALLMTMSSRVPKIRVKTLQALEAWVRMKVGQT